MENNDATRIQTARFVRSRQKAMRAAFAYAEGDKIPIARATAHPPCNGCTGCCRSCDVQLLPRETGAGLDYEVVNGIRQLRKHEDGSCIHLIDNRCTVYKHRPIICRLFDCRDFAVANIHPEEAPIREAVVRWKPEAKTRRDADALNSIRARVRALVSALGMEIQEAAHIALLAYQFPKGLIGFKRRGQ